MTPGNDLRQGQGPQGALPRPAHAPGARAEGAGQRGNGGVPGAAVGGVDRGGVAVEDPGAWPEAAEAEQLVEQVRSATAVLEGEVTPGSTEDLGWAGLLAGIRAAARTQRAIAEAEERLVTLRERAAAEADAIYEAAAGRAEQLVSEARAVAAAVVRDARAESAQVRRDAEASAHLVRSEADGAAVTILGEADREAGAKLAAAELTLRDKIAQAEREAALILERSQEQATAWMAETKQACADMVRRAREEADRILETARPGPADGVSTLGRSTSEPEPGGSGHEPRPTVGLTGPAEAVTSGRHRTGMAAGEPLIGSRGATTAFTTGVEPSDRSDETGHRERTARGDGDTAGGGRRRRFGR